MAERSKAPDSRGIPFPELAGMSVLVSEWRRGFESHSWQLYFFYNIFPSSSMREKQNVLLWLND